MLRSATRHGRWRRWFGSMGDRGRLSLFMDQQRVLNEHGIGASKKVVVVEGPPGTGKSVCAASFLIDAGSLSIPTLVFAPPSEATSPCIPMLRHLQDYTQLGHVDSLPHMNVQSFAQWCLWYNDEFAISRKVMSHTETAAFLFQHIDSIPHSSLRSSYKSPIMLQRAVKDLMRLFEHLESHGISPDEYASFVAALSPEGYKMSLAVFTDFAAKQTDLSTAYEAYRSLLAQHNNHPFFLHAAISSFDRILVDDLQTLTPAMLKVLSRIVVTLSSQHCVAFTRPTDNIVKLQQLVQGAADESSMPSLAWNHVQLTANLYSAPQLIQAAAALTAPSCATSRPLDPVIATHLFASAQDEVDFVADLVARVDLKKSVTVMCADRREVPLVVAALQKRGVGNVRSLERQNLFDFAIVQTAHALLQAVANPLTESKYLFSLLHTSSPWHVVPSKLAAVMELQRKRHVPLWDVLVKLAEGTTPLAQTITLDADSVAAIKSFVSVFSHMRELSMTLSCLELLHAYFTKTGELEGLMSPTSEADAAASQALAAYFYTVGEAQHSTKSVHVPFVAPYLQLLKDSGRLVPPSNRDDSIETSRVTVVSIQTATKRHIAADTIVFSGMADKAFPGRKPREPTALPMALLESIAPTGRATSQAKRQEFIEKCRETLSNLMLCAKLNVVFTASGGTPSRILAPLWQSPTVHHPPGRPSLPRRRDDTADQAKELQLEHVSFSQLDEFMRCPYRYYLARVVKIDQPTSPGLVYGRSLHEGIAAWSSDPWVPDASQNALDALNASWESGCFRSKEEEEMLLNQATDALAAFIAFETANPPRIDAVESPFDINVPEANIRLKGNSFSLPRPSLDVIFAVGVWDRIDVRADGTYVVEFKSNMSNGPRNNQALAESSLQLQLYMLAYAHVHGVPPRGGVLRSIESPHGLNDEGVVQYDAKADDHILRGIADTVQRIRRREFDALPSFMGCAFCAFADVCPSKYR
ncbi:hypothetical protein, variant 1 [Aphanomyces invadans]|uniref:UvrD-like helicase C-terminal domain-containing protein n=1 Tax=Aphanomyces invadans TaxID=157072 RepID=A0A024U6L1_9STRA|nr:hypothetical protein, variant 1 [Aphanomyces invadans]ETW01253.1 hypothetical protein, variant 1 [Aphanomyces invadans]|eukprot:XP_008870251.1 hypothetical protein, variant 1 [Aphanomyces invadans]